MENKPEIQIDKKRELNSTMLILQCIGIVAVVFGHADIGGEDIPNFINYAFPYYSWHMPFFIFISGYFFNRNLSAGKYILKKLRQHLLPALLVNAAFGVIALSLKKFNLADYGQEFSLRSFFITPFTTGYQFFINVSLWFIFALIIVEIIACLMDRIVRNKGDFAYLGITLIVALYCCYRAFYDHEGTRQEFLNAGLRLGFLMFFFWLGACYRKYFEKILKPILNFKCSILLFILQSFILGITEYKITYNTRDMNLSAITVPHGFWVAIVAPITGILFFLGIAYSLSPYIKDSKLLREVGRNTKYVVYYHQFIFIFFSIMIGALIRSNIIREIPGFSFEKLFNDQYYSGGNIAITCVVALLGIALPIIVCRWIKKQKWHIATIIYVGSFLLIVAALFLFSKIIV